MFPKWGLLVFLENIIVTFFGYNLKWKTLQGAKFASKVIDQSALTKFHHQYLWKESINVLDFL